MTRRTTWTNADGLVVGYGPGYNDRDVAGDIDMDGPIKTARLHFTYQSTFGASGVGFTIPANCEVVRMWIKITTDWAGGNSLSLGDAGSAVGWYTTSALAQAAMVKATSPINPDGAYGIGDAATNPGIPKVFSAATPTYFTSVGTWTAGEADLYIQYSGAN